MSKFKSFWFTVLLLAAGAALAGSSSSTQGSKSAASKPSVSGFGSRPKPAAAPTRMSPSAARPPLARAVSTLPAPKSRSGVASGFASTGAWPSAAPTKAAKSAGRAAPETKSGFGRTRSAAATVLTAGALTGMGAALSTAHAEQMAATTYAATSAAATATAPATKPVAAAATPVVAPVVTHKPSADATASPRASSTPAPRERDEVYTRSRAESYDYAERAALEARLRDAERRAAAAQRDAWDRPAAPMAYRGVPSDSLASSVGPSPSPRSPAATPVAPAKSSGGASVLLFAVLGILLVGALGYAVWRWHAGSASAAAMPPQRNYTL